MAKDGFRNYLFEGQPPVVLPCADDEAISMWVADMAFASAPAARKAIVDRVEQHSILGYTANFGDDLFNAFSSWCQQRYGWAPQPEHFLPSTGVVPALYDLIEYVLGDGQKALTLTPAYGYFKNGLDHHRRELVTCGLVEDDAGRYAIDMADFEAKVADPDLRMFILCHPHNPTGRVWTEDELRTMANLCFANDVLIISDEIHCDLLRTGLTHTPLAKLFPDSDQIITCMSASKTFNLAGLGFAMVVIPNDDLRAVWLDRTAPMINPLSAAATVGVFTNGQAWLTELQTYLDANFAYVKRCLAEELQRARFIIPDATYLAWVNLEYYFNADANLTRYFAETVGVLVEGGDMFVADADGHVRINIACPRSVLEQGLTRIIDSSKLLIA